MVPCEDGLQKLPNSFTQMSLDGSVKLLLQTHIENASIYYACKQKQQFLKDWINAE